MRNESSDVKPCVFVHTNERQMLGARVAEYALKRNSRNSDKFDVGIISTKDEDIIEVSNVPSWRNGHARERAVASIVVGVVCSEW